MFSFIIFSWCYAGFTTRTRYIGIGNCVYGFLDSLLFTFCYKKTHQVNVINDETSGNTGIFTIYNEEHMMYSHQSDYSVTPPSYDSIFQMNVSPPPYEVAVREENSNTNQESLPIIHLE